MTKTTRPILLGIALSCLAAISNAQAKEQLILAIGGEPEQGFDPLLGWGSTAIRCFNRHYSHETRIFHHNQSWPPSGHFLKIASPGH
ncbi:hypothetical protein HSBAA_17390 [Vreelandella sulfidaeris]|uniref:Leucine-binding protein domain-containing protein n=1 Tax=Vreelandella sulfidaeris TaxID=115553 RepID=A0A455U5E5_9GAMM|nr:hypothetical protein HSBAA_17390 [Halomonas sulfidaeris]